MIKNNLPTAINHGNAPLIENYLEMVDVLDWTPPKTKEKYKAVVDPAILELAYKQGLLKDRPRFRFKNANEFQEVFLKEFPLYQDYFFKTNFSALIDLGITSESIPPQIEELIARRQSKSEGIIAAQLHLLEAWLGMKKVFQFMGYLSMTGVLNDTHVSALYSIGQVISRITDLKEKALLAKICGTIVEVNKFKEIYEMPELLSQAECRTILFACPVLYEGKERWSFGSDLVKFLPFGPEQLFLFSLFNDFRKPVFGTEVKDFALRSNFNLSFRPKEPLPADLPFQVRSIEEIIPDKEHCSIIATPYHDERLKELQNPNWQRFTVYDPFLLLFPSEKSSHTVMVRRWSGTGIFPAIPELVATSIQFLETAKESILNKLTKKRGFFKKEEYVECLGKENKYSSTYIMTEIPVARANAFIEKVVALYKAGNIAQFLNTEK